MKKWLLGVGALVLIAGSHHGSVDATDANEPVIPLTAEQVAYVKATDAKMARVMKKANKVVEGATASRDSGLSSTPFWKVCVEEMRKVGDPYMNARKEVASLYDKKNDSWRDGWNKEIQEALDNRIDQAMDTAYRLAPAFNATLDKCEGVL